MEINKTSKTVPMAVACSAQKYTSGVITLDARMVSNILGTPRLLTANEVLDMLEKLRAGAVTDSNRIGELVSEQTTLHDQVKALKQQVDANIEEAQERANQYSDLREAYAKQGEDLARRNEQAAVLRAAINRMGRYMTVDQFIDIITEGA